MATFLDYRSSENSNIFIPGAGLGPIVPGIPSFIGGIGLIVGGARNIRVDLWGTIGVTATIPVTNVQLFIVRNANTITSPTTGTVIFTALYTLDTATTKIITINAADLLGTPSTITPGQINYALFAEIAPGGNIANVTRNGPEVFTGMAVTG